MLSGTEAPFDDGEDERERVDREASELLEEIRVVLPGVQVLFAFLLALPFQSRWESVDPAQRQVYFASLCLALVSSTLLIAPSAWHRVNYRRYDKHRLVVVSTRCAILGIALLALAMSGALFVIADELYDRTTSAVIAVLATGLFVLAWAAFPLRERVRRVR